MDHGGKLDWAIQFEAPVVFKMNLAKLTTAFLGKGTIFNYQFTHNYIRETLLPLFKSRKFAPRETPKRIVIRETFMSHSMYKCI